MDGLDGHAARPPLDGSDRPSARIAEEFGRIMGHAVAAPAGAPVRDPAGIDVATYLLNPPRSPVDVERRARRQRIVGIGSVIACILFGVVLVAPWPGGGSSPRPDAAPRVVQQPAQSATRGASVDPPAAALPERLDVPTHHVAATRLDAPRPHRGRPRAPGSTRVVALPRRATPAPAAARSARPARPSVVAAPSPAPVRAPTMLVPLS
jgi:hypothetical protein